MDVKDRKGAFVLGDEPPRMRSEFQYGAFGPVDFDLVPDDLPVFPIFPVEDGPDEAKNS